jgi:hypothetical protein
VPPQLSVAVTEAKSGAGTWLAHWKVKAGGQEITGFSGVYGIADV